MRAEWELQDTLSARLRSTTEKIRKALSESSTAADVKAILKLVAEDHAGKAKRDEVVKRGVLQILSGIGWIKK